ncbi:hypothetical protein, partial [uncultured Abyssibacter sp.]|uniref:hypothetical protein n=1 Tax=uncultured Abyssibacter sp. TaxID=2320202 RepID=UPI0032B14BC4
MSCALHALNDDLIVEDNCFIAHFDGYRLESVFQPIFSYAHHRAIGHEALLRVTDSDGTPIAPLQFLCRPWPTERAIELNALIARMHVANMSRCQPENQWLFLNVDPVDTART